MSRSLVLGNGSLMAALDEHGILRDFYFHYVGLENQMHGCIAHVLVYVDGVSSSLTDSDWVTTVDFRHETMASSIIAKNQKIGVEISFLDIVYNEQNIFIRRATIRNLRPSMREIKIFFHHQFHMYETNSGDTGYFDPEDSTIVHYKGRRIVVVGGEKSNKKSFDDYTVGLFGWGGHEGTWKDAEDGVLSKNPIEHGSVDSTVGFYEKVEANSEFEVYVWLSAALTLDAAKLGHKYVLEKTPQHLIESTSDFWKAWGSKSAIDFDGLKPELVDLFKKSLFVTRVHIDNNGGILASLDSDMLQDGKDTYSYVWMRDGSYVAMALDKAGYSETTRKFFQFANDVLSTDGYFFHKYRPDKAVGSSWHPWILNGVKQLPIQEDETAIAIYALWKHYKTTLDLEFVERVYNSLIRRAAYFMVGFRDGVTKLPSASYDLWEMKYGISTYTSSCVYGALVAASSFASLLGKQRDKAIYEAAAKEIQESILTHLYNKDGGYFYKHIEVHEGEILHDNTIDVSSFYGLFAFNILPIDDPRLTKFFEIIKNKLMVNTPISGIIRFEGDIYYKKSTSEFSNPWIITTLWICQYLILKSKSKTELENAKKWIDWVHARALSSGVLPEQVDPYSGFAVSATPLGWSHVEFIATILMYLEKLRSFK